MFISNKNNKKNIFLNIDSFHNQNNWGQGKLLKTNLKTFRKKI